MALKPWASENHFIVIFLSVRTRIHYKTSSVKHATEGWKLYVLYVGDFLPNMQGILANEVTLSLND